MSTTRLFLSCILLLPVLILQGPAQPAWSSAHAEDPMNRSAGVVINEILASNGSGIEDEDGDTVPWIELYNAGDEPVNLAFYGLSDDYDQPWRWIMPDVTIPPGEFLLIFASGKDRSDPESELHTNFRISQSGEEVLLTDLDGRRIGHIPPTPMPTDVSFGHYPDGSGNLMFFDHPTPGAPNTSAGFDELLDPPDFSLSGGFYSNDRLLELATQYENAGIRYTLDGSEPDNNSRLYSEPIPIRDRTPEPDNLSMIETSPPDGVLETGFFPELPDGPVFKGTVVRARTMRPGSKSSRIISHSYFVDDRGADRYHLPVVSIVTDSLNLFDYETGIYVPGKTHDYRDRLEELDLDQDEKFYDLDDHLIGNYGLRGHDWERPAAFELFDEQGRRVHAQDIGIRIHGGGSRVLSQKSLRLYARNEYGDSRFFYPIFPDLPYREYNRLILRNSGQDFFGRSTMFRDAFMQKLISGLNFDTQAYRPAILFINGEYWGIQNIRERYDPDYIARNYDVDPERVDMLNDSAEVDDGSNEHYLAMLDYIERHDPARPEHYRHILTLMDMDNYLDYVVAQVFIRNVDWPGNNNEYWRLDTEWDPDARTGHDGRWRWLMIDTDAGFGLLNPWRVESYDMINHITNDKYDEWPNPLWSTWLIRRLLRNESFRHEFINRSADYMNTIFHPTHVIPLIDRFENNLDPVIEEHIRRWGQIDSKDKWHYNVERLREFARMRPQYAYEHIRRHFELKGLADLQVDVSNLHKGRVKVNRLVIDEDTKGPASRRESPYPWKGKYFKGIPVTLEAKPFEGYRLSHWMIDGERYDSQNDADGLSADQQHIRPVSQQHDDNDPARLSLILDSDQTVQAVFEPDDQDAGHFPETFPLAENDYHFDRWDPDAEPGSRPDNMIFQYMADPEPRLGTPVGGIAGGAYNLSSRTRINGLGKSGFSFINTSNLEGNPGYPGRRLGAALLAVDTRRMKNIRVSFTGGTVEPHSRVYHWRLQYRVDTQGDFEDVIGDDGKPVEYERNPEPGHSRHFENIGLPGKVQNKPRVELRWLYYYTGQRIFEESGARSRLRLGNIKVTGDRMQEYEGEPIREDRKLSNYPNPFNHATFIQLQLKEETQVTIALYDINGRKVRIVRDNMRLPAGHHSVRVDAGNLSTGIYIYRVQSPGWTAHGKMTLVR